MRWAVSLVASVRTPQSRIRARNGPQMNDELPAPEERRRARSTREAGSAEFLYRSVKDGNSQTDSDEGLSARGAHPECG